MLLKFNQCVAGTRHVFYADEVADLPPALASQYLGAGVASAYEPEEAPRAATPEANERATQPPPKPIRRRPR